jgi:hypothetical protein
MAAVLERFGSPSGAEAHRGGSDKYHCVESCWLRLWYVRPFTSGIDPITIDFSLQQVVVEKYQWVSP